jgi:hypothetical protein
VGRVIVKVARLGSVPACFSALYIALCMTGCAGGSPAPPPPPPPLSVNVSLSAATASVQAGIGTQGFTATVQNDSQSKGVNWTLTQSSANCSPGCGTLSATSSASGAPITYTAPFNQPNPTNVTLTATSVADTTKNAAAMITVTPSVAVSVSPTPINVQFNAIEDFTATVQNDSQNRGVNWTLTQSGGNCSPGCGTLSATSSASGAPIRYTGPSSVPANPSVTLTATSVTDAARSFPAVITVTNNPGNTQVTVTPKRAAITKWQTQSFTATVTGANNTTVTWQVDTIPNGNASVGTIDSNGKYTPPATAGVHTIAAVSNADVSKSATAPIGVTDLAGVYTYHNDISRTGANIQEFALTNSSVATATFGKLFSCSVDAAIYAQPLWVANLSIGGAPHNVVFAVTQRDTVYAFDANANPCSTLWQTTGAKSLIPSGETWVTSSDVGCSDLVPDIGITGTPVIDPATSTMYVVTKTKTILGAPATFHQRLHALSILDGSEKFGGPVDIQASVPGNGNASSNGIVAFDPFLGGQRPALLLDNGHVIISWASHCDNGPYHGWAMSYAPNGANALAQEAVLNTSPNGALSGVWMSGSGPAADASGNIYFATGNGSWDGNTNFGDSIVKLGPPTAGSFPAANFDYFTPINQASLSSADQDLGSGGLLLLPDLSSGAHPRLLVQAGKEGKIYLVNRDTGSMGRLCATCTTSDTQIVQELPNAVGGMFGSPAYWNGNLYFGGSGDTLKAFSISVNAATPISNNPTSQSSNGFAFPGVTPSVSSNGNGSGIVWVIDSSQYCTTQSPGCNPAVLHAYDATNLATELWNSTQSPGDTAGNAVKFTVPTVANGKVYIGTRGNDATNGGAGELDVYGLKPN